MNIRLVELQASHLDQAARLSRAVGWPHRQRDWQWLLALGKGLALVEGERLVGTAMHWSFSPGLATLGMVIVAPERKRQGLGKRLMEATMDALSAPSVELHATPEGGGLYRELGFVDTAWVHQCQGHVSAIDAVQRSRPGEAVQRSAATFDVRAAGARDVAAMAALDAQAIGSPRTALLHALLEHGEALVVEEGGCLAGFAICREFGHGHVIGPVVATTLPAAKRLIECWFERLQGDFVRVDTPDPGLAGWLGERGLREVDRVRRMRFGADPGASGSTMRFALASQALG